MRRRVMGGLVGIKNQIKFQYGNSIYQRKALKDPITYDKTLAKSQTKVVSMLERDGQTVMVR
jgi:hypothetical protein